MARTTAVSRTMRALRQQGAKCAVVEKFNSFVGEHGIRQDLFGIVDILVLDPEKGFIGIQVCGADFAAHLRKLTIDEAQASTDWLKTPGGSLQLWGWRKILKKRGGIAKIWQPRIKHILLEDIA